MLMFHYLNRLQTTSPNLLCWCLQCNIVWWFMLLLLCGDVSFTKFVLIARGNNLIIACARSCTQKLLYRLYIVHFCIKRNIGIMLQHFPLDASWEIKYDPHSKHSVTRSYYFWNIRIQCQTNFSGSFKIHIYSCFSDLKIPNTFVYNLKWYPNLAKVTRA